jgi:hypothetical protein
MIQPNRTVGSTKSLGVPSGPPGRSAAFPAPLLHTAKHRTSSSAVHDINHCGLPRSTLALDDVRFGGLIEPAFHEVDAKDTR